MTVHPLGIGIRGLALSADEARFLRETPPFGVVLFARNVESAEQVRELVREIKSQAEIPPLVMIDEEGGRVDRLRRLVPGIPGASHASLSREPERFALQLGRSIGLLLRHVGVDVNLAPVVDVERDVPVHGLEDRSWGRSLDSVVNLAGAFVQGQRWAGVGNCLKHFPGMGGGEDDPHKGTSNVRLSRAEILNTDLAPFRALGGVVHAIMIGHCVYTQIDPRNPATLSPELSTSLLRRELSFEGLAVSDDLEMHAVSDLGSYPEVASLAIRAGSDVVLVCSRLDAAAEIVHSIREEEGANDEIRRRLAESDERSSRFRAHIRFLRERSRTGQTSMELVESSFERLNSTLPA